MATHGSHKCAGIHLEECLVSIEFCDESNRPANASQSLRPTERRQELGGAGGLGGVCAAADVAEVMM